MFIDKCTFKSDIDQQKILPLHFEYIYMVTSQLLC